MFFFLIHIYCNFKGDERESVFPNSKYPLQKMIHHHIAFWDNVWYSRGASSCDRNVTLTRKTESTLRNSESTILSTKIICNEAKLNNLITYDKYRNFHLCKKFSVAQTGPRHGIHSSKRNAVPNQDKV